MKLKDKILAWIPADYWHGIIPVVLLSAWIPYSFFWHVLWGWKGMWLLVLILSLISLQFFNEWKQMVDPLLFKKYGSLERFVHNSKRDTKFFVIGVWVGLFVGVLIYSTILRFGW